MLYCCYCELHRRVHIAYQDTILGGATVRRLRLESASLFGLVHEFITTGVPKHFILRQIDVPVHPIPVHPTRERLHFDQNRIVHVRTQYRNRLQRRPCEMNAIDRFSTSAWTTVSPRSCTRLDLVALLFHTTMKKKERGR